MFPLFSELGHSGVGLLGNYFCGTPPQRAILPLWLRLTTQIPHIETCSQLLASPPHTAGPACACWGVFPFMGLAPSSPTPAFGMDHGKTSKPSSCYPTTTVMSPGEQQISTPHLRVTLGGQ